MPPPEIPDKVYFRIGEAAEIVGVETHVLRFWESEFPQIKPQRAGSKQRLYQRRDVERFLEIKRLLYDEKYTIAGAKQLLRSKGGSEARTQPSEQDLETLRHLKRGLREIKDILDD